MSLATHVVTPIPGSAGEGSPQWSPDGTLIAATSATGQVVQRPDGSSRVVRPGRYNGPWSADGRYMLYAEDYYRMAVDGVDVLTGEFNPIAFAGGAMYTPNAWAAPSVPLAGFVTVFADRPWQQHRYIVCLYSGDSAEPPPTTHCLKQDTRNGGRRLDNSRHLGPLPPDQLLAISVLSRDWSGNVGAPATAIVTTPHQIGSTLTGRAAPPDLTYGHRSVVTGRLTSALTGAGRANVPVTISRRRSGTSGAFTPVGSVKADASGACGFAQAPSASSDYQLTYAGDPDRAPVTTTVRIRVARRVSDSVDHPRAKAGTIVGLTAITAPALVNGKTYLQIMLSNGYRQLGPHNTTNAGRVVYGIRAPARGTTLRFRVYVPGVSGYLDSYGAWVAITGS